jgi:hypothetical protein
VRGERGETAFYITYRPRPSQQNASTISASLLNPRYVNNDNLIAQTLRTAQLYGDPEHAWTYIDEPRLDQPRIEKTGLAILATCKQIYNEAAPLLYSQHLVFSNADALITFASHVSPRNARFIRHIKIDVWDSCRSGSGKRRRLRGQTAIALLKTKGVELETLQLGSDQPRKKLIGQRQVLRRSVRGVKETT